MDVQVITAIIFVVISLFVAAVLTVIRDIRRGRRRRADAQRERLDDENPLTRLVSDMDSAPAQGFTAKIDRWFNRLVLESGINDLTPQTAMLLALTVAVAIGGVVLIWQDDLLAAVAGFVVGIMLVVGVFALFRMRQQKRLLMQLPESVELLARAMRAGESLEQAIETVGTYSPQPLAVEYCRSARQMEMGLSMAAAMQAFSRRVLLTESRILAATLILHRKSGGNLPQVLERLAKVFRDRQTYRRQFRAATAAARGGVLLISGISVAVAVYLLVQQPEYAENFIVMPQGQIMLAAAIILHVVGLAWIFRLLKTDY